MFGMFTDDIAAQSCWEGTDSSLRYFQVLMRDKYRPFTGGDMTASEKNYFGKVEKLNQENVAKANSLEL